MFLTSLALGRTTAKKGLTISVMTSKIVPYQKHRMQSLQHRIVVDKKVEVQSRHTGKRWDVEIDKAVKTLRDLVQKDKI